MITVLVTVVVVSLLGTALSGRENAARLMSGLEAESQVLTSVFGDTLSDPLWDYDYNMVQQRLEHLVDTRAIVGARVFDSRGNKLAEVLTDRFDPEATADYLVFDHSIIAESGEWVGTLFLWVSTAGVSAEVWSAIRYDAATAGILAVITAIVVFAGVNLISGPLSRVADAMIRIGEGALETEVPERGRDGEVSRMADALEQLRLKSLRVEQAERDLRRANAHLEQRVSERTVELETAREQAVEANRAKTEFLANMSHDLRTPLNAILGFSEIMRAGAFGPLGDPRYEEYVEDIHHSGSLLISLINDLLDISKVEAGKYELTEEVVDIRALIHNALRQIATAVEGAALTVATHVPADMPALRGDGRVLTQILNNLLSNSVKFTPRGGHIDVSAWTDHQGQLHIRVADNGIGMTREGVTKALRPFEQAHNARAREHNGTGLGLHLCDNFMKLFGGSLEIKSEEGGGTTVTVAFPAERAIEKRRSA
ncbi:sensor histidine kinase [Pelagibius litoralis]|uniref:sensor histidine kinase n=1 Tax=Pelagibius litoralis TaxID=374515 RepID=UPI0014226525|nr:ATP-binding protein [Pelagibius litoralis]